MPHVFVDRISSLACIGLAMAKNCCCDSVAEEWMTQVKRLVDCIRTACPKIEAVALSISALCFEFPVLINHGADAADPWAVASWVTGPRHGIWKHLCFLLGTVAGDFPFQAGSHRLTCSLLFFLHGLAAYYYFYSCKLSFSLLPSSLAAGATLSDSCVSPLIADVILMMNLRCNSWLICTDVSAIRVLDSLMVWFNHGALGENMLSWVTRSDQELTWFALHSLPAPFCFCFLMYDCMTSKTETTEHVWKQARGEVRVTLWNWHVTCCVSGWYLVPIYYLCGSWR